jgi:hypothetical protein
MAKRVRNWKPDIYDMTADRSQAPPQLDVRDLAAVPAPPAEPATTEAEADVVATAVVVQSPEYTPVAPGVRLVRLVAPPPRRDNDGLLGLVAGAVVGAALTLLITPASGDALRTRLRAQVETLSGAAANRAEALAQKLPNSTASGQNLTAGEQDR